MPTRFERDTAVRRRDAQTFDATVDPAWWVQAGPNGGYVAAIILRALIETVDEAQRSPRSLTIHYTAPPKEGDIAIATDDRASRTVDDDVLGASDTRRAAHRARARCVLDAARRP